AQHRLPAVPQRPPQHAPLEMLRRARQRFKRLPDRFEIHAIGQELRAEIAHVPVVEPDLPNVELRGVLQNPLANQFLIDGVALRRLEESLPRPRIVGRVIALRAPPDPVRRTPRMHQDIARPPRVGAHPLAPGSAPPRRRRETPAPAPPGPCSSPCRARRSTACRAAPRAPPASRPDPTCASAATLVRSPSTGRGGIAGTRSRTPACPARADTPGREILL